MVFSLPYEWLQGEVKTKFIDRTLLSNYAFQMYVYLDRNLFHSTSSSKICESESKELLDRQDSFAIFENCIDYERQF